MWILKNKTSWQRWYHKVRNAVIKAFGGKCFDCGKKLGRTTAQFAHLTPNGISGRGRGSFLRSKTFGEMIIGMPIGIFLMFCYLTTFYGTFSLIKEKRYSELTLLLLIIIYFSVLTGVIGNARFKLPITPFYVLIASIGISRFRLIKRLRKR